jgi:hypothetical protein
MVREPTKTLYLSVHGALAFTRGASCSIKSRDPTDTYEDRTMDFATPREIVNAANKNKRVLFDPSAFWRTNSPCWIGEGKNVLGDRQHAASFRWPEMTQVCADC